MVWLTSRLLQGRAAAGGEYACVLPDGCALGDSAYTGVRFSGPWGLSWRPPAGARAVLVQTARGPACVGTVETESAALEEGELLLKAQGGASIYLKNNGQVLINGTPVAGGGAT